MLIAVLAEGVATAQSGIGYIDAGPGSNSGLAYAALAAGGELVLGQTVGVGGEAGAVLSHSSFGYLSLDGSVHILRNAAKGRFDPFITGGYTRAFAIFAGANGGNACAGFNYWFTHRFGIRAEFRDMVFSRGLPNVNYWAIRGGIAFR
jgi:hypothetical protein